MEVITVEGIKCVYIKKDVYHKRYDRLYNYDDCIQSIKDTERIKLTNKINYCYVHSYKGMYNYTSKTMKIEFYRSEDCFERRSVSDAIPYEDLRAIINLHEMINKDKIKYKKNEIELNQNMNMESFRYNTAKIIIFESVKYVNLYNNIIFKYDDCIKSLIDTENTNKLDIYCILEQYGLYCVSSKFIIKNKYIYRHNISYCDLKYTMNRLIEQSVVDKIETKPLEQPKIKEAMNQPPKDNINLCFVGGVSTGKSTILNAVFSEQLTQCKIKRTTMVPTIYVENDVIEYDQSAIYKTISDKNQEMIEKSENGIPISKDDYQELIFHVGKLDINILPDAFVNVYDIPGLNDARTKNIYYEYLETNFHKFNMVIFLVDIHSGLNTSDEIDILNFITNNTKYQMEKNNRKIYTLVVVNKADDMQFNEETHKLEFTGEMKEMYEQVQKTIHDEFKRKDVESQLIDIIPLCAIDAYLYRMVQKHGRKFKLTPEQILKIGINENGKKFSTLKPDIQEKKVYEILNDEKFIDTMIQLSGFSQFEEILHTFLNENDVGKSIRIDNLLYDLRKLPTIKNHLKIINTWFNIKDFKYIVNEYVNIYNNIKKIDMEMYNQLNSDMNKEIEEILNGLITKWTNSKYVLLDNYDAFISDIIEPYLINYSKDYPLCLKTKIIKMIEDEFKCTITTKSLVNNFNLLKKLDMFKSKNCSNLITILLKNERKEKTLIVYDVDLLIPLLNELIGLEMNISRLVRFLIINQLNSYQYSDNVLMIKKMLYYKYKEIPIYHYLQMKTTDITLFVYGMDDFENSEEYKLDIYYLENCKDNINFN
jgi:GTP-binding protein EngB required for normal cell division